MKSALILLAPVAVMVAAFFTLPNANPAQDLLISSAIARPLGADQAAAFLTIENRGAPDRLLSVSSKHVDAALYSPAAETGVPVPAGAASLALDAAHITLSGLSADIKHGALIPVTLQFEQAGNVQTKLQLSDPAQMGSAQAHGVFGIGDICVVGEGEPAPAISLTLSQTADGYAVQVHTQEFEFSENLAGLYHVPGVGHGHLYVGGMKLGRLYEETATIGALPKGTHEVRVTLNTNDHRAYVVNDEPVTATAMIVVD